MESALFKEILFFLYKKAQNGKNPLVQSETLQKTLQGKNWKKEEYQAEFYLAIGELIDNQFIEQVHDCYRITDKGKELARKLRPASAKPLSKFEIFMLFLLVAFSGLMFLQSRHQSTFKNLLLSDFVNENNSPLIASRLGDWFDPVPANLKLDIPFDLSPQSLVVETNSQNSKNDYEMVLPVNVQGAVRIHLLINMSYASLSLAKIEKIAGNEICRIWWTTSKGKIPEPTKLFPWIDIRDWLIGNQDAETALGSEVTNVWTGRTQAIDSTAGIDYYVVVVPESIRQGTLISITIDDRSWEILSNTNPGIVIFGVVVEYKPVNMPVDVK